MVDAIPLGHYQHSEAPEGLGFRARRLRVASLEYSVFQLNSFVFRIPPAKYL